jgi:hypothetical protein
MCLTVRTTRRTGHDLIGLVPMGYERQTCSRVADVSASHRPAQVPLLTR